jgi:DNA polymerase III delta subunit
MAPRAAAARAEGVSIVAGTDSHLAEEALEQALQQALVADRTEAVQVFRGDETTWTRVLDAARSGSLFATRRAVVVRNAEALKGEGDDVPAYLDDPTPGVALILVAAKPDKRKVVWKRLFERAEVMSADPLKGRAIRTYVVEQLRRRKLALDDDGVLELVERVGQDLRRTMGEIEKLEAFAGSLGRRLTAEDVASVLGRGLARPLYRIADAFTARRTPTVLAYLEEALDDGEPALKVLGTLHRALRQVRGARALREARASREEVASRLQVMPFKVGDLLEATRSWSEADLQKAMAALDLADRRVKTGSDPRMALTAAVVGACGGARSTSSSRAR